MLNFSTPEEKALIKNSAGVFAQAHELTHDGVAGNSPIWSWPDAGDSGRQRPGVLLLHGWGGEAGLMAAFVAPLLDLGYRVLIPDLPGQGKTKGRLVDTRVSAATIVELHNRVGPFHSIIGHSLGGLLGCMVAAGHEVFGGKVDAAKLVTINSPVSLGSVISGLGGAMGLAPGVIDDVAAKTEQDLGLPLTEAHAQVMLERANVPTLAFHDTDDPFIPHAGSLAQLARHEKLQTRQTSGLGHISVLEDQTVIRQVTDFLGQAE
ncbi:MAG: alpha/beta fold hydrolase [Rhizobiales bacterium]|nr:alpha/beta fold hydrolase [Hyphomicrobiales bacterium]